MSIELEEKIKSSLVEGGLPCSSAFDIARELNVNRREVGDTANSLKIRVTNCQLGFFIKDKATHDDLVGKEIDKTLIGEIESSLVDGHITCPQAFNIAGKLKVTPKEVGDAASKQGILIINCQLGLFP
ncbi:hypothetical protein ACFLU1_00595 [Chloroflexota bacterium]